MKKTKIVTINIIAAMFLFAIFGTMGSGAVFAEEDVIGEASPDAGQVGTDLLGLSVEGVVDRDKADRHNCAEHKTHSTCTASTACIFCDEKPETQTAVVLCIPNDKTCKYTQKKKMGSSLDI